MARVIITRDQYDLMVAAFREQPGNASHAARSAKCTPHTARRAYRQGYPDRGWPAIKETVGSEQKAARAARQKAMREEVAKREADAQALLNGQATAQLEQEILDREKARQDAIQTRKEEGQMIRGLRGDVGMMLAVIGKTLRGATNSAGRVAKALETGVDSTGRKLTLKEEMSLQRSTALMLEVAAKGVKVAVEAERLLMGEPTEILGLTMGQLSEDDAVHVLEVGQRAIARHKKRFEVIEGGKDDEEVKSA